MIQIILYNLQIALDAIAQNKLRSFLTSLGIIFGVASVIAMLAIGRGAQQEILEQMKMLGANNIIIKPVIEQEEGSTSDDDGGKEEKQRFTPGLSLLDLENIRARLPQIQRASPEIIYETLMIRGGLKRTSKLVGVAPDFFPINNLELADGQMFTDEHIDGSTPVCIIGHGIKAKFFAGVNPIGQKIKAGRLWLTVVGVLDEKVSSTQSLKHLGIRDFNMDVYTPVNTALLRFKNRSLVTARDVQEERRNNRNNNNNNNDDDETRRAVNYHQLDKLIVQVSDSRFVTPVTDILSRMLQRRHNDVIDFEIIVPEQLLQQEQRTKQIFNIVLSSIASISLIVGGIGIMNIMLASVVERFKEIGVRMAIGARKQDIMLQFLTEAMTISLSGGAIGVILGIGFSIAIREATDILTIVTPFSILISFAVALGVGVTFGLIPARRAADHEPADALRYE